MKSGHAGMRISNPEFDAALGDLKASLDRLQIPNKEQKELLSIIEARARKSLLNGRPWIRRRSAPEMAGWPAIERYG